MFTINRELLAKELALLQSVAEKKNTIPILSFVKIECQGELTTLTATDLDATIISTLESSGQPWSGCVTLRQLLSLVRLLESDAVEFAEQPNERIEIKDRDSRHLLPFKATESFPAFEMPQGSSITLDGGILANMIAATSFWIRPYADDLKQNEVKQTGLSLRSQENTVEVMAQNRTAAAIATLPIKTAEFNTIIPKQAAGALKGFDGDVEITCGDNLTSFVTTRRTLVTRHIVGSFPPWRTMIPTERQKINIPETLKNALRRVTVTTNTSRVFFEVLKLTLSKESIKLQSRGGDNGQSEETLPASSTLNGESVEIGINGNQTLEALNAADYNVTCEFTKGDQPLIFVPASKNFELCYLTMPCRLEW